MSIIDEIIQHFSEGKNFKKLIEPIIIKKDSDGSYNAVELLNRLAYTIVDQRRKVISIVIPLWVNMMYKDVNPEFLAKSPYATEFIQSMFKAYGHQNYHTKSDLKIRDKSGGSRTDAFVQVYKEYSPDEFLEFIKHNHNNIESIFKELVKLKYISSKSASFFLRDIEDLKYDILPVDVNIAYSFQYTGLFFNSLNSFENVYKDIVPVSKRTNIVEYSRISNKIRELCSERGYDPYELNRYLFLLGEDFCQSLKCKSCFLGEYCYFNNLSSNYKEKFASKIKSN